MRKLVASVLVAVSLTFGAPTGLMAQSAIQMGSISGEAVDAGGRGVATQRVELVQSGQVIQTTVTGLSGTFVFGNVPAGDYVVRVVANGQPAGVRVSVTPGGVATHAMIVLPSAAAPSAAFLGLIGWLLIGAAIIGTTAVVVASTGS